MQKIELFEKYGISGKMEYYPDTKTAFVYIMDHQHNITFYTIPDLENVDDGVDDMKNMLKSDISYKLSFSIMRSFYEKWDDLVTARDKVYQIHHFENDPDKRIQTLENYIKNNKIRLVCHL